MNKFAIGCGVVVAVVIGILLIAGLAMMGGYNGLVKSSQQVDQQWAQVQNNYQRRADLIPNLVQTVSGAANFEKSTLTEITEARASVGKVNIGANSAPNDPKQLADYEQAQGRLSSALSRLLVVSERYPDLKANANFRDLQAQLEGTENRITVARADFNQAVGTYNTKVKSFPTVIYAGMFGYSTKPYFNATPGSDVPPKVQFDFGKPAPAPAKP